MYSSVAALPLNTFVNRRIYCCVVFNYCDLPHLLQNLACLGIAAPHMIQCLLVRVFSLLFTLDDLVSRFGRLNAGCCCCFDCCCGLGMVYSPALDVSPVPASPLVPKTV